MDHIKVQLKSKQAVGYVIPLGPLNLVDVVTDVRMVGCGAFDVAALNNFATRQPGSDPLRAAPLPSSTTSCRASSKR
jgi:hypothetical protein